MCSTKTALLETIEYNAISLEDNYPLLPTNDWGFVAAFVRINACVYRSGFDSGKKMEHLVTKSN